ncbi:glycosyltransferase family 2 protein [Gilvimarinus sp. SDUM040013]|uniref:Glycosyltransferase family 2 protein n=1 Tax=Gilvimarinus gilvus TaxID=3058038 RepID=A0ABU4S6N3_9GAMM|nr:glycosyltransferase family 2 protein [Gilvimarinus sp. SDUM040013]MDO3387793.1 glycosyltransferase family 2 protein [Gilvimarinus sp. SDUM040013]MDX6851064.1 glycosyltransferase family 2 protein [Gilvimarinus sp. SDUM040013]
MSPTFSACVVIPVYNHAHLVGPALRHLRAQGIACILVNDGGDDAASDQLKALSVETASELIEQYPNGGKGSAVLLGMHHAYNLGYSHAVQIDADGQHCVEDVAVFIARAQTQPEAVVAGIPQYDASVPKHRLYSRYITHFWVWVETLSLDIKDSMCGFRVYPLAPVIALARDVKIGERMDFDTEILVRLYWRGLDVISVPTKVIYPEQGVSNFRIWGDNIAISWMHTKLVAGMLLRSPVLLARKLRKVLS